MLLFSGQDGISFSDISQQALENLHDLVRILDMEGNVIYANRSLKSFVGADPTGTNCFFDEKNEAFVCKMPVSNQLNSKRRVIREKDIDGRKYSIQTSPVTDEKGNVVAVIEIYHDITREHNMYRDLFNHIRSMRDDISFARRIQQSLLPTKKQLTTLDFDYRYLSSEDLSGDIFDYFYLDEDHLAIYICDVMGKGISASMMTMFIRQSIRSLAMDYPSPAKLLGKLRENFSQLKLGADKYFTCFYAVYNRKNKRLTFANGGHNCKPALLREGKVEWIERPGLPISQLFLDVPYKEETLNLSEGDALLLYTDGIIEVQNKEGEQFGLERLEKILSVVIANHQIPQALDEILYRVNRFCWGDTPDDIALVLMQVKKDSSEQT